MMDISLGLLGIQVNLSPILSRSEKIDQRIKKKTHKLIVLMYNYS